MKHGLKPNQVRPPIKKEEIRYPTRKAFFALPDSHNDPRLLSKRIIEVASANTHSNGILLTLIANYGNYELTQNFVESLRRIHVRKFLIVCLDTRIFSKLSDTPLRRHIALVPEEWITFASASEFALYGSDPYNKLMQTKMEVVLRLMQHNFSVLYSDVDIVWLSPYVIDYLGLIASGSAELIILDDGTDELNCGYFMVKPTENTLRLISETIQLEELNPTLNDQNALNLALNSLPTNKLHKLDRLLFANGNDFLYKRIHMKMRIKPWVLHFNFLIGLQAKVTAQKLFNVWFIGDSD